jgi:O-antigen/teichoic acid export membrane protein
VRCYARIVSDTESVARRWLRFDAVYCGAAGVITLALCVPFTRWFEIPLALTAGIGAAVLAWAWLLTRLARRPDWRQPLRLVAGANAVASVGVAGLATLAPDVPARLLLIAVAAEVAAFAAVQLRTLRRADELG